MPPPEYTTKDDVIAFAADFPFFKLIGLEVLDVAPGRPTTRIAFRPDLTQPFGIIHGGVMATLIDTGIAHALMLTDRFQQLRQEHGALVSIDLRVKYFRPVSEGIIQNTLGLRAMETPYFKGGRAGSYDPANRP